MGSVQPPKGCLLVGSVPLSSTEEVFRTCLANMPNRLLRIPDGETGERHYFVRWQVAQIQQYAPEMIPEFGADQQMKFRDFTTEQVEDTLDSLKSTPFRTGYDDAAIHSYGIFKALKTQGIIPQKTKFQVCLPTSTNVLAFVERAFRSGFEPIYEKALFTSLRNLQDQIPHEELAIQLDLAIDTGLYEGVAFEWWGQGDPKRGVIEKIVQMMEYVDTDVELGFHNCYGDSSHKHFYEPTSMAAVVERTQAILDHKSHPLKWFHVPVPLSAMDKLESYLLPLKQLVSRFQQDGTELYLGLVHFNDLDGTKERIEAAQKVLGDMNFGVSTECGWGRTPAEQLDNIMTISTSVSQPAL